MPFSSALVMFPTIDRLAADIAKEWAAAGHRDDAFCAIAARHLRQDLQLDFATVARRVCEGFELPRQRRLDEGFGQPGLTLYHDDRFLIEALCWHSGTPAIHEHAFSGAFRLLTGRSVHSRYVFTERERVERIALGDLRLVGVELLDPTSIVEIPRGQGLIHSTFHLDSPSMTLVARTHPGPMPEPTYLPPGVAYDSASRSVGLAKRLQVLDTLAFTRHSSYQDCSSAAIEHSDLYDGMAIVMRAGSHPIGDDRFHALLRQLGDRCGAGGQLLSRALIEERRRGTIARLRSSVVDQDRRFFLACLLSFSGRSDLWNAMQQHYGAGSARQQIAAGVAHLLGGDADRQAVSAAAAEALLDDVSVDEFPETAARLWERTLAADERSHLRRFYEQVREHPLLTPLRAGDLSADLRWERADAR